MSPVRTVWWRTVVMSRSLCSTAFAVGAFLCAGALLTVFNLSAHEGGTLSPAAIWAAGVSPFLPALAAFLAMDVWSDERRSGRWEMLLSSPVLERDLTLGKFLGVYTLLAVSTLASLASTVVTLEFMAPSVMSPARLAEFAPGLLALLLQGALWCAVSVLMSSLFAHAAVAACASLMLLVALPRGGWAALMAWAAQGRTSFGEMPLDAHALDMASGLFSSATVLSYLSLTVLAVFISSKCVAAYRFSGRGSVPLRFSTAAAVLLSIVFTLLVVRIFSRFDVKMDIPLSGSETAFSPRTRDILMEGRGDMTITCFLSRRDPRFRPVGRFLRALKREADSLGGISLTVRFVDPGWDIGSAERLVRSGAQEDSLVFEKGRRTAVLPLSGGYGERLCASTILRLTTPPKRRCVYWTVGHGESAFDSYGAWGMSDIARDLARDGYQNAVIDLAADTQIPSDCALIVVAGAKDDFSRVETARLDYYLRGGGRLLVLMDSPRSGGVSSMLPGWGLRPESVSVAGLKTLTGSDVIVSDFSGHEISSPLAGSRIVLDRPVGFAPSAAAETGSGVDRIEFTPLATAGQATVAAVVERGVGAGADLSIRPTRIVAVGDSLFVMNGQLSSLSNANRDFFLNCVAYLSGTDALASSGVDANAVVTGFDRSGYMRFALVTAVCVPVSAFLLIVLSAAVKRRRS